MQIKSDRLYIALFSVHGLIRGENLELGRDADTGGQTLYVVELARALAERPEVEQVDLFTRRIVDAAVDADYAESEESLGSKARIVRLNAGPDGYIRKELLWDFLDAFADNALDYFRAHGRAPNFVHSHYADAGYVGLRIAHQLGVPLVHTGHSLGRVKRRRLLASGLKRDEIESRYNMSRRVEAEEATLEATSLVIVSSHNEIEEQYELYDHYQPERMAVVPPGTDLERFHPPTGEESAAPLRETIARFLRDPDKPMILALSRLDERKNIVTLLDAYGDSPDLQAAANLVIVAGNRDDIRDLDAGPREILGEILALVDYHDLYGRVAYPKQLSPGQIPMLYRLAAMTKGVFVNPALTEPFGLTLIEAAASGLPLVATEDGGPRDIIANCDNGLLIDPLDKADMARALLEIVTDEDNWQRLAINGLKGVQSHYAWHAHATHYLEKLKPILRAAERPPVGEMPARALLFQDRSVVVELDHALLGDAAGLKSFVQLLRPKRVHVGFGVATAYGLGRALKLLRKNKIPLPDLVITGMGTEIHYAPQLMTDIAWAQHIDHQWNPRAVHRILRELPGLELGRRSEQLRFKLRYDIDHSKAPAVEEINRLFRKEDENINLFISEGRYLDVTPARASKGFALRYFADQWNIPLERILVVGASASDETMVRGNTLGAVVANPQAQELSHLADVEGVYFCNHESAKGIIEAIEYYDFFGACRPPEEGSSD
ncbi:MAG: HAD family hydrolase [Gammaproteobacteria bacterium]